MSIIDRIAEMACDHDLSLNHRTRPRVEGGCWLRESSCSRCPHHGWWCKIHRQFEGECPVRERQHPGRNR